MSRVEDLLHRKGGGNKRDEAAGANRLFVTHVWDGPYVGGNKILDEGASPR
jgi:hypothetical protein